MIWSLATSQSTGHPLTIITSAGVSGLKPGGQCGSPLSRRARSQRALLDKLLHSVVLQHSTLTCTRGRRLGREGRPVKPVPFVATGAIPTLKGGVGCRSCDVYGLRPGSCDPWQSPRSWDHQHWRSHGRVARPVKSEKAERQESPGFSCGEDVKSSPLRGTLRWHLNTNGVFLLRADASGTGQKLPALTGRVVT